MGGGIEWIDLVQDRNRQQTLVNAVMNLWVPQNVENQGTSQLAEDLLASQAGLCSVELVS
jgi:hypothetical protein